MELLSPPPERIINEEVGTASMRETRRWLYSLWQELTALVSKLTTAQTTADNAQAAANAAQGTANAAQATATAAQTTANAALPAASAVVNGGAGTVPKVDANGNTQVSGLILAGATTGSYHKIYRNITPDAGQIIADISHPAYSGMFVCAVSATGFNAANAAVKVGKDAVTLRSMTSGGSIVGGGSDLAEYERKSAGCGTVAKGQVIGFDPNGEITDRWANALTFGVKATDPYIVGGDTWGTEEVVGPRPVEPKRDDNESDTEWDARIQEYTAQLAGFETRLEAERQKVDRIAYAGKVPVNVYGAQPGDYIVAVQDGEGIGGMVVPSPAYEQYRNAVGRVRKILEDGRAQIAVMVH